MDMPKRVHAAVMRSKTQANTQALAQITQKVFDRSEGRARASARAVEIRFQNVRITHCRVAAPQDHRGLDPAIPGAYLAATSANDATIDETIAQARLCDLPELQTLGQDLLAEISNLPAASNEQLQARLVEEIDREKLA
jgi:hypothetical protein